MNDEEIDFQPIAQSGDGIDFQPMGQSPTASYTGPNPNLASEEDIRNEPGLQDVSIPDTMTVQGVAGLGKLGVGLAGKGIGAALDAIPATENFVPTIERVANNQTLKSLGGTMGQIRQMAEGRGGREALDEAAQYARDKGLADVFSTSIGREKQLEALKEASGKTIGSLRNEAGPASEDVLEKVSSDPKLEKYFGTGSASKELGGVESAMNDIEEVGGREPTNASLADAATYINKNAAGNKLYQPVNAETDVANVLSNANNEDIVRKLGSDKAKQYIDALGEQTKLHPLEHLQQRGELRQMGGRGGSRIIQAIADKMGYRMTAQTASAIADMLNGRSLQPSMATALSPTVSNLSASKYIPQAIIEWMNKRNQNQ